MDSQSEMDIEDISDQKPLKSLAVEETAASSGTANSNKAASWNSSAAYAYDVIISKRAARISFLLVGIAVACFVLYNSVSPFRILPFSDYYLSSSPADNITAPEGIDAVKLRRVLKEASAEDKTVILTTLNDAWAEPNSMLDLFLTSFKDGNQTQGLLKHLVMVTLDQKAYNRCLALHPHCFELDTRDVNFTSEASFMSSEYLTMMWRRIQFLGYVLELGYNFVFTDIDIMWLRDPFQRLYPDADFQIACDGYIGDPKDVNNRANGGFTYARSNERTIEFYKFWYNSRLAYPGQHDQNVFDKIKYDPFITDHGLELRFLDTTYFGGFCEPSRNLNLVCTMHANCCIGQDNKIRDLKLLLEDWRKFMSLPPSEKESSHFSWSVPKDCLKSFGRTPHGR